MNWEHQIAAAFMHWWSLAHKGMGLDERLLHAIPNAGGFKGGFASNVRRVAAMKAEGVRSGVSDYFLAVPRGTLHGLYLELKAGGPGITPGRLSKEQKEFGELVAFQGYGFKTAWGTDGAIKAVQEYLATFTPIAAPLPQ